MTSCLPYVTARTQPWERDTPLWMAFWHLAGLLWPVFPFWAMAEWKMKKTKKAWSVEGFPVPNRVLTEFTMEIKPALPQQGITKGYAAQLQEKKSAVYIQGVCTVALLAPRGDLCFPCCCVRSSPHVLLGIQYVGRVNFMEQGLSWQINPLSNTNTVYSNATCFSEWLYVHKNNLPL